MIVKHAVAALATALVTLAAVGNAHAELYTFTGDTSSAPTFNRPVTRTALSNFGTDVRYAPFVFTASAAGAYTFITDTQRFDAYTFLYRGVFAPTAPLANLITLSDDIPDASHLSGFVSFVDANTTYTYVTAGFENLEGGPFVATISGPGSITPVPEPAAYGMLLAGLALVGALGRRKAA